MSGVTPIRMGSKDDRFFYSDLAIETLLTVRELYQLTYRTTEGFGRWIFDLMRFDLPIPDYTSLCKRAPKLGIDIVVSKKKGKIDVVLDSTGLKVYDGSVGSVIIVDPWWKRRCTG